MPIKGELLDLPESAIRNQMRAQVSDSCFCFQPQGVRNESLIHTFGHAYVWLVDTKCSLTALTRHKSRLGQKVGAGLEGEHPLHS